MRKWFLIVLPPAFLLIYVFANYILSSVEQSTAKTFQSESAELEQINDQINNQPSLSKNPFIKSPPTRPIKRRESKEYTRTSNDRPVRLSSQGLLGAPTLQNQELSQEDNTDQNPTQKMKTQESLPFINTTQFIESPPPRQNFSISFINAQTLPPDAHIQDIPIGGLSALSYDPERKLFFALSDDKGQRYPSRFYEIELLSENPNKYNLEFKKHIPLLNENNQPMQRIDPEGIVFLDNNTIFISSEGAQTSTLTIPPALFTYNIDGQLQSEKSLEGGMFWDYNQVGSYGVKENKGFEALTVDTDNNQLWMATEKSLHQDDPIESENSNPQEITNREYIRFNQIDLNTMRIRAQYIYPIQSYIEQDTLSGNNGVTDFLSLGDSRFIVLERAYLRQPNAPTNVKQNANLVRLFLADCSQANNVAGYQALQGNQFVMCGKSQIIGDLSNFINGYVDNIEGIAKVPETPPGQFVLVLVSDNNFSPEQQNQFLFFRYKPNF